MKALAVFSGGLDSMLAAQLLRAQGIEVEALFFETPFFASARARKSAESIRLPLKVIDVTRPHLEVVRKPGHGYGGNMNPCIDCHALMLREAGDRLSVEGARFIVTGEVLGQRPMSQNLKALSTVAALSGYQGLILRPLSAKLLSPTIPEEKGWVRRDALMGISGRSRKPQMELAATFHITDYPSPAGGCLLTDPIFSRRLRDLLSHRPRCEVREIELLKVGRHFRLGEKTKAVVGRNKKENEEILSLARESDLVIKVHSVPGPVVLVVGEIYRDLEGLALALAVCYSDAADGQVAEVKVFREGSERSESAAARPKSDFRPFMI